MIIAVRDPITIGIVVDHTAATCPSQHLLDVLGALVDAIWRTIRIVVGHVAIAGTYRVRRRLIVRKTWGKKQGNLRKSSDPAWFISNFQKTLKCLVLALPKSYSIFNKTVRCTEEFSIRNLGQSCL